MLRKYVSSKLCQGTEVELLDVLVELVELLLVLLELVVVLVKLVEELPQRGSLKALRESVLRKFSSMSLNFH